ncbi:MAG TPA: hypothetical protein VHX38_25645 [Pseudonocardiaceae bacterium]|jgi:predicted  nucleic acid-binding Zn-ribbon protein|nr:hypothetical protein [Pseudonocardiaceae bacterium]
MISKERLEDLLRRSAVRAGSPVWRRVRPRMETIAVRAADIVAQPLRADLARLWNEVNGRHEEVDRLREELNRLREEFYDARRRLDDFEHHNKLMPEQVAAIEARLSDLEAGASTAAKNGGDNSGESTAVLDEIRTEHRRIRARLTAVALYEERIGRLENSIAERSSR